MTRPDDEPTESAPPNLPEAARGKLSLLERANVAFMRSTFSLGLADHALYTLQRILGATWVDVCTRNLRSVHGVERLPPLHDLRGFVLATNHRSYFDLYVVSMTLIRHGLRRRMLYPVRSKFFYDHPLGWFVNGAMSFWSMYPPVFRERKRALLNHVGFAEVAYFLRERGSGVGIHPEGTRNQSDDPYELLPAQSGVGRLIHGCKSMVIPAFINGLSNDLPRQVAGNFNRTGDRVNIVFGPPVQFGDLLEQRGNGRVFKQISQVTLDAIAELGAEERQIRAGQA